jgi:hypothetical protein
MEWFAPKTLYLKAKATDVSLTTLKNQNACTVLPLIQFSDNYDSKVKSLAAGLLQKMASGLKGKVVHVKIVVLHLFPTEIAA